MNSPKVESELRPLPSVQVETQAHPEDVERFLAALEENGGVPCGDERGEETPGQQDTSAGDETSDDDSHAPKISSGPATLPALPERVNQPRPMRPVTAVRRAVLATHQARSIAMQPLAELLAGVRARAEGRVVSDLKIVPTEPNPLRLTLLLSMKDGEFVVKASTELGADRRDEVQQALQVLEAALGARLQMPARVVLLA